MCNIDKLGEPGDKATVHTHVIGFVDDIMLLIAPVSNLLRLMLSVIVSSL